MFVSSHFSYIISNLSATTEIYTLSLHDALPICVTRTCHLAATREDRAVAAPAVITRDRIEQHRVVQYDHGRSEEHTSELQSRPHLVCRLLLEKKKKFIIY